MAQFSFDIVSSYDASEVDNVYTQALKEIQNRYDFKGTPANIEWLEHKKGYKIIGSNEWQVEQIIDLIRKKLATRNQSSKILDLSREVHESNMKAWQEVPFKDGLSKENAKKITKALKEKHPKLKTQIQGDEIRVTSSSKDDLQRAIQTLTAEDYDFPLVFTNYR